MRLKLRDDSQFSDVVTEIAPIQIDTDTGVGNDKTFLVPNNETWKINWVHVTYTSTATVGNRLLKIYLRDTASTAVIDIHAGLLQAASLVVHYLCGQGVYRETTTTNGEVHMPIPQDLYVPPGYTVQVVDENDVDSADTLSVTVQYKKFTY